jgi:hypothetical protein
MRWKYCIHHTWPEERTEWAEAFVRPDDDTSPAHSLWVTIDCLGSASDASDSANEERETLRRWLGDRPYAVPENGEAGDSDLVVNARDFTKAEFLDWIGVWLRAKGFTVSALVPAPLDEFAGTHAHADVLIALMKKA